MDNSLSKMFDPRRVPAAIILLSWLGVIFVGLQAREPMIGDEVTHYYLAVTQSRDLSTPTITAEIPAYDGELEVRNYPHVFLWHYLAAIVFRVTGGSFSAVQIFHSLFWLQLLIYTWLLFKFDNREGVGVLLYLVVLASLPACLIFGVAFYQDVPAIAQMMASFYYLRKRWLALSVIFMILALSIKETIFIIMPAYFCVLLYAYPWKEYRWKTVARVGMAAAVFLVAFAMTAGLFISLRKSYYPYAMVRPYIQKMGINMRKVEECLGREKAIVKAVPPGLAEKKVKKQVANNPGDARSPVNLLIYGGGLIWITACMGLAAYFCCRPQPAAISRWSWVWAGCGAWYIAVAALMMRTSPDVRFLVPGVPLLLVVMAELAAWLPRKRVWLSVLLAAAVLQGAVVLGKTHQLREIKPGVLAAIEFLRGHRPEPNRIFMYPEGSYRLFPCPHEWYMGYDKLRIFWKADNDQRLVTLRRRKVGAIVVKKWLVGPIDKDMNNLGIYPDFFVRDIAQDFRFEKTYENSDIVIYSVPPCRDSATNTNRNVSQ